MLILYQQFLLKQAVRGPIYLTNPPVIQEDETQIPRNSVIHLLDLHSGQKFPDRNHYYFREIPKNKKIKVLNVLDLERTEDTVSLHNRYLGRDAREWRKNNIKHFRESPVTEVPNDDLNNLDVVNYNPVKDLYNYKSSLTSGLNRHINMATTYWTYVRRCLDASPETLQIVRFNIPRLIPSHMAMNRLLGFTPEKISRIVTDPDLMWVMDLYRWLTNERRKDSPLADISDEDSKRIILELKVGNYSTFLPLSTMRGVFEESELPSTVKFNTNKSLKLFIIVLNRIQEQVTSLSSGEVEAELAEDPYEEEDPLDDIDHPDHEEPTIDLPNEATSTDNVSSLYKDVGVKKLDDAAFDDAAFTDTNLSELIDEVEDSNTDIDKLFTEANISKVSKAPTKPNPLQDKELAELEFDELELSPIVDILDEDLDSIILDKSPKTVQEEFIQNAIESKTMTASEIKSFRRVQEQRAALKAPNSTEKVDDFIAKRVKDIILDEETIKIQADIPVPNEALKQDVLRSLDKNYLNKLYRTDVVSAVFNLEKAGIIIKNYEVDTVTTSVDRYETHKLTIKPLKGKESTIYFRLPIIDEEGTFMASGIKYRMRRMKQPEPIVKVSPTKVALTSNYGKLFISLTERKTNNRNSYFLDFIRNDYLGESATVTKIVPKKKQVQGKDLPSDYVTLATNFDLVQTKDYTFTLAAEDAEKFLSKDVMDSIAKSNRVYLGYANNKDILTMDKYNNIYNLTKDNTLIGRLDDLLNLDHNKTPKPFSTMKVLGDDIPLGVILGYYIGLSGLIKATGTSYTVIGPRDRYTASRDELELRFEDHKLILKTDTPDKQLLFNGYLFFKDTTKKYPLRAFDNRDVYFPLIEQRGSRLIHLKELDNLRTLFLDPLTLDVLEKIKEPTDYIPLLLRANELINKDKTPDVLIRGYDRVPGLMYMALSEAIREHNITGRGNSKISLDPYKVWNYITQDSTVKSREVLNPILTLKENEAITLTGKGGLPSGAIPASERRFKPSDAGLISEGTVDSAEVAVVSYLSPYAKINDVRGTVDRTRELKDNPAALFSSPVQLAPFSERDDCLQSV